MIRLAVVLCASLAACSAQGSSEERGSASSGDYATILEAPPYTPIERFGPELYTPTLQDRRSIFADRIEQQNLPMLRRLKKDEMGNFGGIEWRWSDGPGNDGLGSLVGVAYFLRAPEQSLGRYTSDPLFSAAQGDFSRVEQDAVARGWADKIGRDIASEGFGNMSTPWLTIAVPRDRFETLSEEEDWDIPVNLTLRFSTYLETDLPPIADDVKAGIRHFPAADRMARPTPDFAPYDTIVLRDGCFFIDEDGDADPLVMFPFGTGVYRDAEGRIAFRSRNSHYQPRLARVGTRMQLGYREEVSDPPAELIETCGKHRVVLVKSLNQAAGYGNDWFAVREYRDREGITSAEAMRRANECLLAQERTMADNRLRGGREHPTQCARVFGIGGNPVVPPPPPPLLPGMQTHSATEPLFPPSPPKKLVPARNGVCRFEERNPAERPSELIATNHNSNMIFWADEGAALWDHPNGFIDEGMVIPGKRIVAAREGMKDLWIFPNRDGPIYLHSGPEIFACSQPEDW